MLILSRSVDTWNEKGSACLTPILGEFQFQFQFQREDSAPSVAGVATRVSVSSPNTLYRELRCCQGVVAGFPFLRNDTVLDSSDPSYRPDTHTLPGAAHTDGAAFGRRCACAGRFFRRESRNRVNYYWEQAISIGGMRFTGPI